MSLCCHRSAILLIVTSLLLRSFSFAGEPPLLISNYLERTSNTKKYACAIFCESTRLDSKSSKKDYYEEIWYLHAFDPESKSHRHDEHRQSFISDSSSSGPGVYRTLFLLNGKQLEQRLNRKNSKKVGLEDSDEETISKALEETFFSQSYFDPFTLTIRGTGGMASRKSVLMLEDFRQVLMRYKLMDEEERDNAIIQGFQPPHPDLYDTIVFDERIDRMPVALQRTFGKNGKFYESVATKWNSMNDKWFPVDTELNETLGTRDLSRKLKYYWMLDDFPKGIFPEGNEAPLHGSELKEAIVKWSEEKFTKKPVGSPKQ